MNQAVKFAAIAAASIYGASALYAYLGQTGGIPALRIEAGEVFPLLFALVALYCLLP